MKKLLFITNRNILTTSGELRLIKNRAEALFNHYEISTDFIVWQKKKRVFSFEKETINCSGTTDSYVLSTRNPLVNIRSYFAIKKDIKKRLKESTFSAVVLSGSGLANLAKYIKKCSDVKIIFDVHGASEDILELTKNDSVFKRLISRIVYIIETNAFKKAFRLADGCFVVTHALEDYLRKRYPMSPSIRFYVCPCGTESTIINEIEYNQSRIKYRKKYGVDEFTKVLIYSGGVSYWQCIEETIQLFNDLRKSAGFPVKLLMFSHRSDAIKKLIGDDNDIIVDSYKPEELKKALCAGDVAIMLRKDCITNSVAFPNKFLEYTASCMNIIATPYVLDVAEQIKANQIGYLYRFDEGIETVTDYISRSQRSPFSVYERILVKNGFKERLKDFSSEI